MLPLHNETLPLHNEMSRQISDQLQNHATGCLALDRQLSAPFPACMPVAPAQEQTISCHNHDVAVYANEEQPPSPAQEVHEICADIIAALVEQAMGTSVVKASAEEKDEGVCSICLDAFVIESAQEASAPSSNGDVKTLTEAKTMTDIKTLQCGDNPAIYPIHTYTKHNED